MARLDGKVALVTGASRGIGAAIARRLAADGAQVAVHYAHDADAAAAVVADIARAGGRAFAVAADLAIVSDIEPLVARVLGEVGRLDALVNNAAVGKWRRLGEIDADFYAEHFDVNVRGALLLAQAAARVLEAGGRIVYLSSGAAHKPIPGGSVYCATKAAVEAMVRCQSTELGPRGITVNAVAPGLVETDMLQRNMDPAVVARLVAATPLGRTGRPDEIAAVVAFLVSGEGGWVTGQTLAVNGGLAQ